MPSSTEVDFRDKEIIRRFPVVVSDGLDNFRSVSKADLNRISPKIPL